MNRMKLTIVLCLAFLPMAVTAESPPVRNGDLVLFLPTESAVDGFLPGFGKLQAKLLNSSEDGRQVAVLQIEPHRRQNLPDIRQHSMEFFVLEGHVGWDERILNRHDFAYLPSTVTAPSLVTDEDGASLLVFLDPPRDTDGSDTLILDTDELNWRPGVVAQEETGVALKLEVMDLLWRESTGQRTWLLRAGTDLKVPWEIHDGVEEGFLLEGDYRMGECLPGFSTPIIGSYQPRGYFYRPGGLVHSGPESGTSKGALWLLRTPTRLTVNFVDGCGGGSGDGH